MVVRIDNGTRAKLPKYTYTDKIYIMCVFCGFFNFGLMPEMVESGRDFIDNFLRKISLLHFAKHVAKRLLLLFILYKNQQICF